MIWHWINSLVRFIQWLFMPPPIPPAPVRMISLTDPCPWCGHRQSTIRAVPAIANTQGSHPKVVRHCLVCCGDSDEPPVIEGGGKVISQPVAPPPMS